MYIERIDLKGFKSFADATRLDLTDGIAAVVGPNGSGKSNILDAVRWALGEQSGKKLRSQKGVDLIFGGNVTRPSLQEAQVTLRFSLKERTHTLRREITLDGKSDLRFDGERIRLADLAGIKKSIGLEEDRYAFIGQGEVAEVVKQKGIERRELLEALFGVETLRKRQQEAELQLSRADADVCRVIDIIAELESRFKDVSRHYDKAKQYRDLDERVQSIRSQALWGRRLLLKAELMSINDEIGMNSKKLSIQEDEIVKYETDIEEIALRIETAEKNLSSERSKNEILSHKREQLRQRIKDAGEERRRWIVRGSAEVNDIERLDFRSSELGLLISSGSFDLDILKKTQLDKESELVKVAASLEELSAKKKNIEESVRNRSELKMKNRSELVQIESDIAAIEQEKFFLSGRLNSMESNFASLNAAKLELDSNLRLCEDKLAAASELYKQQKELLQKHGARVLGIRRERSQAESIISEMREKLRHGVYPQPVQRLISASQLNKLDAKPIPFVECFTAPSELVLALEAFLGGRLYWLIVETFEESQECIDLLKKSGLGRATFLPLEKCAPRHRPSLSTEIKTLGWACDLVKIRHDVEKAVLHVMGDLLIVNGYDDGKILVRNGFRASIATLGGDVFAPAGTVSGGSIRQQESSIAIHTKIREAESRVVMLEHDIAREDALRQKAEHESEHARVSVAEIEERMTALGFKRRNVVLELDGANSEKERVANRILELGKKEKTTEDRRDFLRKSISDEEDSEAESDVIAALNDAIDVSYGEKNALEKEVAIYGQKIKSVEEKLGLFVNEKKGVDDRLVSINALEAEVSRRITELGDAIRDCGRQFAKATTEKNQSDMDLLMRASEIAEMSEKRDEFRKGRNKAVERMKEDKGQNQLLLQKEAKLRQRLDGIESEIASEAMEKPDEISSDERVISFLEGEINTLREKMRKLGKVNVGVLEEYDSLSERLSFYRDQLEDLDRARESLRDLIDEIESSARAHFTSSLNGLENRFSELFRHLFNGGEAHLDFSAGEHGFWQSSVEIAARPPGKSLQYVGQMSGGEQSMTAIALLFSAMEVAKVPVAILDEVDAALDEANLDRFADLAAEYGKHKQIIIMTHRRRTMEKAELLYGVTMEEPGVSKLVGVRLDEWL